MPILQLSARRAIFSAAFLLFTVSLAISKAGEVAPKVEGRIKRLDQ